MKKPIINFNRRNFLEMAAVGAGTIFLPKLSFGQETYENPGNGTFLFQELARNLSVVDDVDVIVCGGGPAGVSAAITAARAGAKVRLFEVNGCLGGIWTAGLLTWIFDFNKPGLT
ncbi:MAG: FAD-dependent oxidoreductase, partial [Mariniphaga sp.]